MRSFAFYLLCLGSLPTVSPQYVEPAWWPTVEAMFTGINLRRCIKRDGVTKPLGPPPNGQRCARRSKTCFFGDQLCGGDLLYPATECVCEDRMWDCTPAICPATDNSSPPTSPPLTTETPSPDPTPDTTASPTDEPSEEPSGVPTPSAAPFGSSSPTVTPTTSPSDPPSTSNAPTLTCVYKRKDINGNFTAQEQQELADLVKEFMTAEVILLHDADKHRDPVFLPWHRDYIGGFEHFLAGKSKGKYVPLPKWNPKNDIPLPFYFIDQSCMDVKANELPRHVTDKCGTLPTKRTGPFNPPLPNQLDGDNVCKPGVYDDVEDLRRMKGNNPPTLEKWHDSIHSAVGGAFGGHYPTTHLIIFLLWHAFVDDIYYCYCQCGDCAKNPYPTTWTPSPISSLKPGGAPAPDNSDGSQCLQEVKRTMENEVEGLGSSSLLDLADLAIQTFDLQGAGATISIIENLGIEASSLLEQDPDSVFSLATKVDHRLFVCETLLQTPPSISGRVLEDTDDDASGDSPISGVEITLENEEGIILATTQTDSGGLYIFDGLPVSDSSTNYTVVERSPIPDFPIDISDADGGNDNQIAVELGFRVGEFISTDNDFVNAAAVDGSS